MKTLMPLRRAVIELTNEAKEDQPESVRKAIKSWHNRLATGSIPRSVVTKLGRELFLDLEAWGQWREDLSQVTPARSVGRPRNV